MSARGREWSVLLLCGLLGHAQYGADLDPASAIVSGRSDGADQIVIDLVALVDSCFPRERGAGTITAIG